MKLLSVVTCAYNEEEVIGIFYEKISHVLTTIGLDSEIVVVNDGSTDSTLSILHELAKKDTRISIVNLSRNFGKEIALTAGLDHAKGDYIVPIDADLQDPPELIPKLVSELENGSYDVVYATRRKREGEGILKRLTARIFYKFMQNIGGRIKIPENTGDFRILNRKALDSLCTMRENHRFMKGLFSQVGYKQKSFLYDRAPRFAGKTKWNYLGLVNLSIEGITSFTVAPLRMATIVGFLISIGAFVFAAWIIYKTIAYGEPVAGYPTLMVTVLFLGGVQLLSIGIIGEYLGRIFNETKKRPLYFVENYIQSDTNIDLSYLTRVINEKLKVT